MNSMNDDIVEIPRDVYLKIESVIPQQCKPGRDLYTSGIKKSIDDPFRYKREGSFAEYAASQLLAIQYEFVERYKKFDLVKFNQTIDVKCMREYLVRTDRVSNKSANIHFWFSLLSDNRINKVASVRFMGWCTLDEVVNSQVKLSPYKEWSNYVPNKNVFKPLKEFYTRYESR